MDGQLSLSNVLFRYMDSHSLFIEVLSRYMVVQQFCMGVLLRGTDTETNGTYVSSFGWPNRRIFHVPCKWLREQRQRFISSFDGSLPGCQPLFKLDTWR
jgi:hypothetical protein